MVPCWNHGNITRSKAEELLSRTGKDGSFLVRASESISRAYALCVLYRNCVYTYRILPNEDDKFTVQASEGVPMRFFTKLDQLIEFYKKENMGLVTHLQYPVPLEEEDAGDEPEEDTESVVSPPELPPRNIPLSAGPCEPKELPLLVENSRAPEVSRPSLSEMLLQRLQSMDTSGLPEEHLKAIQDYLSTQLPLDSEFVKTGSGSLPHLKKLTTLLCRELYGEVVRTLPSLESLQRLFDQQLSPGLRPRPQVRALALESPPTRRSLIPPVTFEVKSESLGLPQKMHLKVDVESGKLIVKKSKDGSEDKFYSHKKSKAPCTCHALVLLEAGQREVGLEGCYCLQKSYRTTWFSQLLIQIKNKNFKLSPGTVDSQGQIEFLRCYATLKTKSQTKFYLEFHSSCLESFVKSQEGENEEGSEGELVVKFGESLPKLTPIISDPEYLLDQHVLISIKSCDSDESYGEGCIALRLEATETPLATHTPLTHHGEMTGHFHGEIKLQTAQGKKREKLYDFVKTERDDTSGLKSLKSLTSHDPMKQWEPASRAPPCSGSNITEIINPNYMGMGPFGQPAPLPGKQTLSPDQQLTAWSYDQPPKDSSLGPGRGESPPTPPSQPPLSPKKFSSSVANRGPCLRTQESRPGDLGKSTADASAHEDLQPSKPEMFENPLYGSVSAFPKPAPRKEQESPKPLRKEPPACPDPALLSPSIVLTKAQEAEGSKGPGKQGPVPFLSPAPRLRSFTCSSSAAEGRPASGDKSQGKPKAPASSQAPVPAKRPIKPSRSEMGQQPAATPIPPTPSPRPPLPIKSPAVLHLQHSKGRDYRENTELPHHGKHRPEEAPLGRTAMQVGGCGRVCSTCAHCVHVCAHVCAEISLEPLHEEALESGFVWGFLSIFI
uniref:Inositol polyphosphate-5-phosphatase D n=1 Tax=Oryctolagus cuniculus TaxID=9986 RepID=G1TR12_RABIT